MNRQVFQKIAVVIKTRTRMIAHVYFKMPKTHKLDIIGKCFVFDIRFYEYRCGKPKLEIEIETLVSGISIFCVNGCNQLNVQANIDSF